MCAIMRCVCVTVLLAGIVALVHGQGDPCTTPTQITGTCVPLTQCPYVAGLLAQEPRTRDVTNYVIGTQSSCGGRSVNRSPIVCCESASSEAPVTVESPPPSFSFDPDEQRSNDGDSCFGPDGRNGFCTNIRSCPAVTTELQKYQRNADFTLYLQNSNGICAYRTQFVCCPTDSSSSWDPNGSRPIEATPPPTPVTVAPPTTGVPHLLSVAEKCGVAKNVKYTKVVGGDNANPGSMPWMALIGYTDSSGEVGWKCGGSLITSRHILTAAHCIKSTLTTVRLGEHDTANPAASAFNVNVVKVARYPNYDAKDGHADLAVLYLERDVEFSDFVRPICLPLEEPVRSMVFVGFNPFVAGWGRTAEGGRPSNVLQQLQLPVLENEVCQAKYKQIGKLISEKQFDQAVLCAGELGGGMDSCQGDSGGPLAQPVTRNGMPNFYQIGIVSYGIGCARADVPGVYTRVQTFVDWIREKVAEV